MPHTELIFSKIIFMRINVWICITNNGNNDSKISSKCLENSFRVCKISKLFTHLFLVLQHCNISTKQVEVFICDGKWRHHEVLAPPQFEIWSINEVRCLQRTVALFPFRNSTHFTCAHFLVDNWGSFFFYTVKSQWVIMNPPCGRCNKPVYPTEKINCLDKVSW